MNHIPQKQFRILALAPSSKGFGFAVLEGKETFIDWGSKTVKRDKNANSVRKVKKLIADYQPGVLVLQDMKRSRRAPRIQELNQQLVALTAAHNIKIKMFSREKVLRAFFPGGRKTKHRLAEILAKRFPEELGSHLPPKRRPWASEDSRMDIFEAVALALMLREKSAK